MKKMPLIIAHRGGKFWKSKNFSYITESIKVGADFIELDIRFKDGHYFVQHEPFDIYQGLLSDALKRIGKTGIYLDIKDVPDVNELIAYVRKHVKGPIAAGFFDLKYLKDIKDRRVIKIVHCLVEGPAIKDAKKVGAKWITPFVYMATHGFAKDIQAAGFKFVPGGNELFQEHEIMEDLVKFASWGAYAIATFHVKKVKRLLNKKSR